MLGDHQSGFNLSANLLFGHSVRPSTIQCE